MADRGRIAGGRKSRALQESDSSPAAKRTKKRKGTEDKNCNETPSTFNSPAVSKALQNPLVLQNIFKFLRYNDLQACQSVDLPLWRSEGEHAINHHPLLIIILDQKIVMAKIFRGNRTIDEFQSISELSSKLNACEKGHEIWLDIDQNKIGWKNFLNTFANEICSLKLNLFYLPTMSPLDLQAVLLKLSNLYHLSFTEMPMEWESSKPIFPKQVLLPQVKTISFGVESNPSLRALGGIFDDGRRSHVYPELLMSLFEMMPNLDNIFNLPLCFIPGSETEDKLKVDKIKSFSTSTAKRTEQLSQLANISQKLSLKVMNLCSSWASEYLEKPWCTSWSRILQSNQSTLEHLVIKPLVSPEFLKYPRMNAVKKLSLLSRPDKFVGFGPPTADKFFPEGFDARKTFPNLEEVTMQIVGDTLYNFLNMIPDNCFNRDHFQGVISLSFNSSSLRDIEVLRKLARLFPNVSNLSVSVTICWLNSGLAQIMRLWPKLTSLKVMLDLSAGGERQYHLDSIFTGIYPEKCTELREHEEKMNVELKSYQRKFALSDLTGLNELTLIFNGRVGENEEVIPLISHVASFYGFQCVPHLKVTCAVPWNNRNSHKIQEMLIPILPYVIFNPSYYIPVDYYGKPIF